MKKEEIKNEIKELKSIYDDIKDRYYNMISYDLTDKINKKNADAENPMYDRFFDQDEIQKKYNYKTETYFNDDEEMTEIEEEIFLNLCSAEIEEILDESDLKEYKDFYKEEIIDLEDTIIEYINENLEKHLEMIKIDLDNEYKNLHEKHTKEMLEEYSNIFSDKENIKEQIEIFKRYLEHEIKILSK